MEGRRFIHKLTPTPEKHANACLLGKTVKDTVHLLSASGLPRCGAEVYIPVAYTGTKEDITCATCISRMKKEKARWLAKKEKT